jgi:hypothetical protein
MSYTQLIKTKSLVRPTKFFSTKHTIKFSSLYLPSSVKDIRLYFRSNTGPNSYLDMDYKKKILVKQSYILLVWMYYLTNKASVDSSENNTCNLRGVIPSFFVYPTRNYKTTVQKAPMAHKTFSQEQYMIRYYYLSITFIPLRHTDVGFYFTSSVNTSLYYFLWLVGGMPAFSTNMFWLHHYIILFQSKDTNYFSFYNFNLLT